MRLIAVGTRGSALARWQAEWVCGCLERLGAQARVEIIHTSGDKHQKGPLASMGGKGLFVKELEAALLRGEVDISVHSLKDVPTVLEAPFVLGAFLQRADPRDCLIAPEGCQDLEALPVGAVVGSCSPRRIAQLLHQRPGLQVEPLRGNVETRLSKVRSGLVSATFLAKAGLDRLGIEDHSFVHPLSTGIMLPAAGQGIVAVEAVTAQPEVLELLGQIDHAPSRWAAEAEREVVHGLGGTCVSPVAAYGCIQGDHLILSALAGDVQGETLLRESIQGPVAKRHDLASELAGRLLARGAGDLIRGKQ